MYPEVTAAKAPLKWSMNHQTGPTSAVRLRRISTHSAGVSVSATIAERLTEIVIVSANCR